MQSGSQSLAVHILQSLAASPGRDKSNVRCKAMWCWRAGGWNLYFTEQGVNVTGAIMSVRHLAQDLQVTFMWDRQFIWSMGFFIFQHKSVGVDLHCCSIGMVLGRKTVLSCVKSLRQKQTVHVKEWLRVPSSSHIHHRVSGGIIQ